MSPTSDADRRTMRGYVEGELAKRLPNPNPSVVDALTAVSLGYIEHRTSPGFSFLDDLMAAVVNVRVQLAAGLVDCYVEGDGQLPVTREVYRPQFRAAVDSALNGLNRPWPDDAVRATLTSLAIGLWKDDTDLRAARGPIAMMVVSYYAWGLE